MTRNSSRRSRSASWSAAAAGATASDSPSGAGAGAAAAAAASATGSVGSGGHNGSTFPRKLAEMLGNEPEVLAWSQHGLSFFICDSDALTHQLLPKYFRHNKLTSFQRQLNLYGFRRITKGADVGAYFHPQFRKDRPDLVARIRRLPGQGATATAKFLPLYYKDVQNSSGKNGGGGGGSRSPSPKGASAGKTAGAALIKQEHGPRGFRSESLASFTSTLSHSSSEGSFADFAHETLRLEHDGDGSSAYGDEQSVAGCSGSGSEYGHEQSDDGGDGEEDMLGLLLGSGPAGTGGGYTGGLWAPQEAAAGGYYSSAASAGGSCDGSYADKAEAAAGGDLAFPSGCYGVVGMEVGGLRAEVDVAEGDDDGCEYTFIDPPPLPPTDGAAGSDDEADAMDEERAEPPPQQPQLYSHSAPARFHHYWQPTGSAAASALPASKPLLAPRPASPLLGGRGPVRSYTPLPMAALEPADPEPATAPAQQQQQQQQQQQAQQQPPQAAALLPKTFSVGSFSQWLSGATAPAPAAPATNTAAPAATCQQQQQQLATPAAALGSPPPAPRPLGKRCSSMNSDLWRSGWGSSDDLTALADMGPEEMDAIFTSLGRDTESVLHSVGLELAADGTLRPDALAPGSVAAANNALASHLALSITAA